MAEETKPEAAGEPAADAPIETASRGAESEADATQGGAAPDSEADGDEGLASMARVAELEAETADLKDRLLRAAADMQNMRKRADKERRDAETFASSKFARDILSVFDNLDQAVGYATDELRETAPGFVNGVELTQRELLNVFAKHKIELMRPEPGDKFDPNVHEAMARIPTADVEPGTVATVMQAGFIQAGRLLRPAMIAVAMAPPAEAAPEATDEGAAASSEPEADAPAETESKSDGS